MMNEAKRWRIRSVCGASVWTLAMVAHPVFAQAPASPDQSAASTSDSNSGGVGEIVVTAQRKSENIQKVPIAIQAISGDQARDLGVRSSGDIGRIASNVSVQQPAGEGSVTIVTIRGIGLNDYSTNNSGPNGIYVDEVYLSAPVAQTFPPFDIERIEVLKGPQGTLYGRNTSGGAINYITKKPSHEAEVYLNTSYGSFSSVNFQGAVNGGLTSNLAGRLAFNTNISDGFTRNTFNGHRENGAGSYSARAELLWEPTDALKILVSGNGSRFDVRANKYWHVGTLDPQTFSQCPNDRILAGQCVDLYGFGTTDRFEVESNRTEHMKTSIYGGSVRADYGTGPLTLTSLTSYIHTKRYFPEDADGNPARLLEIDYNTSSRTVTQELRGSLNLPGLNVVAGGYFLGERLTQNQPLRLFQDADLFFGPGAGEGLVIPGIVNEVVFSSSAQKTRSYALFGQVDYDVLPDLTLTVGGRYSWERKSFTYNQSLQTQQGGIDNYGPLTVLPTFRNRLNDGAANYRVALNYKITPAVLVYASNATGFKSGGFNGSFLSSDPTELASQLQPVKPEKVRSYEVGLKSTFFNRKLLFNIAFFYNDYRDMQVFTPIVTSSSLVVNVLDNAPKAHTQGIDAQLAFSPIEGLTISENLGILSTELDRYSVRLAPGSPNLSGNRLPLAPKVSSSTVVDYHFDIPSGRVSILASADFKSKMFFDTTNDPLITQGKYWLFNGRIGYTHNLPKGTIELAVFGRNLTDKKYLVGGSNLSPFGMLEDIVGRPREFGVELNMRY